MEYRRGHQSPHLPSPTYEDDHLVERQSISRRKFIAATVLGTLGLASALELGVLQSQTPLSAEILKLPEAGNFFERYQMVNEDGLFRLFNPNAKPNFDTSPLNDTDYTNDCMVYPGRVIVHYPANIRGCWDRNSEKIARLYEDQSLVVQNPLLTFTPTDGQNGVTYSIGYCDPTAPNDGMNVLWFSLDREMSNKSVVSIIGSNQLPFDYAVLRKNMDKYVCRGGKITAGLSPRRNMWNEVTCSSMRIVFQNTAKSVEAGKITEIIKI